MPTVRTLEDVVSDDNNQPMLMMIFVGNAVIANHTPDNATDVGQVACEHNISVMDFLF